MRIPPLVTLEHCNTWGSGRKTGTVSPRIPLVNCILLGSDSTCEWSLLALFYRYLYGSYSVYNHRNETLSHQIFYSHNIHVSVAYHFLLESCINNRAVANLIHTITKTGSRMRTCLLRKMRGWSGRWIVFIYLRVIVKVHIMWIKNYWIIIIRISFLKKYI